MRIASLALVAVAVSLAATSIPTAAQVLAGSQDPVEGLVRQGKLLPREALIASGGATVYEAVRRLRREWFHFDESRSHFAAVYVDGEYVGEPDVLRVYAVEDVLWVQYSDRGEARVRFPSLIDAGAIHVSTRLPLSAVHPPLPRPAAWESRAGVAVSTFARRALGREDYFGDARNAIGFGAGAEIPVRANLLLTASVSYGSLERSCPCPDSIRNRTLTAQVGAAGVGMKIRGSSQAVYSPYFTIGAEVLRAGWDGVEIGGVRNYLVESADWGYGGTAGVGADMRISGRLLAFAQGDVSLSQFPERWAGPTRSFRLGSTLLLGPAR
jgi:hypothetical protein